MASQQMVIEYIKDRAEAMAVELMDSSKTLFEKEWEYRQ